MAVNLIAQNLALQFHFLLHCASHSPFLRGAGMGKASASNRCRRSGSAFSLSEFGGMVCQHSNEPAKNEAMDGVKGVPIEQSKESLRLKERGLSKQSSASRLVFCLEFEPGPTGHFHFGAKAHHLSGINSFHTPKI